MRIMIIMIVPVVIIIEIIIMMIKKMVMKIIMIRSLLYLYIFEPCNPRILIENFRFGISFLK